MLLCGMATAQTKADKKEQIAAFRVAFITKELSLTSREAQLFWPVYNEYQDKLESLRTTRRKENKKLTPETMTDQEAELFIDDKAVLGLELIAILNEMPIYAIQIITFML